MERHSKKDRVAYVIQTANEMFLQKGLEGVSMEDIAEGCQLGVATIYRYFKNKKNLLLKCGSWEWQRTHEHYKQKLTQQNYAAKRGEEQLYMLFDCVTDFCCKRKDFMLFLYKLDLYLAEHTTGEEEMAEYNSAKIDYHNLFVAAYKKGVEQGDFKPDIDVDRHYYYIAHAIMSSSQKLAMSTLVANNKVTDVQENQRFLVDLFMNSIKLKP